MNEEERRTLLAAMRYSPDKVIEMLNEIEWGRLKPYYKLIFK